jgi:nicotinic acid mononucleotide adenylyltransferase
MGHITVIKTVLEKKLVDYVLVYALPESDTSKNRAPIIFRFAMLESIFVNHPNVLITKLPPAEMQNLLMPFFKDIQFSVVQGSDVINQYINNTKYDGLWMRGLPIKDFKPEHANTSLGAIMAIPAKQVIAFNRAGEDLSYVGNRYKNRPLTIINSTSNADLSSTKVREAVQQGKSLADVIPPEVLKIIQENKLYQ